MSKYIGDVSAYAYAVSKGYTGTEEEFAELMADYADVGQRAEDAAESALNSKTAAQTAATTAATTASEASTSATSASSSASAASASASAASGSATSAANSATAASGSATAAAGSAITASTKASEAAQSEANTVIAKNAAEAAQTAAETAQGKAEDAKGEAETTAQSISASAAQIATNTANITQLQSEVSELPIDGVVGNSKQLLSENGTDNTEPYMFRAVPVNADRAELDAVVGGTVAWNQMVTVQAGSVVNNGVTYVIKADGSVVVNGTATGSSYVNLGATLHGINGHKILVIGCPSGGSGSTYYLRDGYTVQKYDTGSGLIIAKTSDNLIAQIAVSSGTTVENLVFRPQLIDLTQMFGSTIADYIYSLEQSTAGAGVAFFRKLFPKDYYPYDAGTLKSVEGVSSHDMVGFNQWDEEWELGSINQNTGQNTFASDRFRSINYISVVPNTNYNYKAPTTLGLRYYNKDKQLIGSTTVANNSIKKTPEDCYYLRFVAVSMTSYNHDICINLSDPVKNGTYEPYIKHTYPLDNTLTLRGIPKLADGKLSYDGDRYLPDGTVDRRYGIRAYQSGDESLADAITDETNTVYKLTTPTTETADSYQSLQVCDPNGTEEFVSTGIVPVGHETRYPENLRAKIEGLPWDFSSLIAPTEKTTTASRNYTTGSLLIMNNVLYKATANIANSGIITPGTNVTATTLAEVIAAL